MLSVGLASMTAGGQKEEEGYGPLSEPERVLRFDLPPTYGGITPGACSVKTLQSGQSCVFDSAAKKRKNEKGLSQANVKTASALGTKLCSGLARLPGTNKTDPDLESACHQAFKEAAQDCGRTTDRALLDSKGHFAANASACYASLRSAMDTVRQAAEVWSSCCACLTAGGCAKASSSCALELARGRVDPGLRSCAMDACASVCRPVILLTEPARSQLPARQTPSGALDVDETAVDL